MKRGKKGVKQLEVLHELKLLALEMFQPLLQLMPPSETAVGPQHTPVLTQMEQVVHIPMDCATYNTEGLCLTGPVQLKWMEQLLEHPREFVLHVDGKHKLHHGGWVLMTIGIHILRWDEHHHTLSTKFLPLVYQMCKQVGHAAGQDTRNRMYSACIPHVFCMYSWRIARVLPLCTQVESGSAKELGSAHMLVDALNVVCVKKFGKRLEPGAGVSDHCDAYRNGFARAFPDTPFAQCWPHIARKLREGHYCKTTWVHFQEVAAHARAIHLAMSPQMKDLLIHEIGVQWDAWGHQMDTFWTVNCVAPWDTWSTGLFDAPLCTPSNNTQEAWHRELLRSRIPGMFRGSTEHVFKVTLPQVTRAFTPSLHTLPSHPPFTPSAARGDGRSVVPYQPDVRRARHPEGDAGEGTVVRGAPGHPHGHVRLHGDAGRASLLRPQPDGRRRRQDHHKAPPRDVRCSHGW